DVRAGRERLGTDGLRELVRFRVMVDAHVGEVLADRAFQRGARIGVEVAAAASPLVDRPRNRAVELPRAARAPIDSLFLDEASDAGVPDLRSEAPVNRLFAVRAVTAMTLDLLVVVHCCSFRWR